MLRSTICTRRLCSRKPICNARQFTPRPTDSLSAPTTSAWDHVFDDLEDRPPPLTTRSQWKRSSLTPSKLQRRTRRQAMTAREISVFEDMFNMIFNAAGHPQKRSRDETTESDHSASSSSPPASSSSSSDINLAMAMRTSIGRHPKSDHALSDLFSRLRRQSRKIKWSTEFDELLDRKKEEMDACETDVHLLQWTMREVFGESRKYEAAALRALSDSPATGKEFTPPPAQLELQPPTYPHLLAHLMRTFRDKHHDPHLALAMFDHARRLSIPSYVFGCGTPAYNELIDTRWRSFRDLRGVYDALEEMRVNGVRMDARTRKLVEIVRREVGREGVEKLREEEHGLEKAEDNNAWDILAGIEALAAKDTGRRRSVAGVKKPSKPPRPSWDAWKSTILNSPSDDDGWEFDRWEYDDRTKQRSNKLLDLSKLQFTS